MTSTIQVRSGERDFDFSLGGWKAWNRRLRRPLAGSDEWDEFESRVAARPLPAGLGNEELYCTDFDGGLVGMSFRFFDPETGMWSVYRTDSRGPGALDPPVFGSFDGDTGVFLGEDTYEGRPILVRVLWTGVDTSTPSWEQAFSDDGGDTWETNWIIEFTRTGEER
jgi:hypothetical protein